MDRVAAGDYCFLNCTDPNKVESWVGKVECGLNGKWGVSHLPLKCIATCSEDVLMKGRKKTAGGVTVEDKDLVISKEEMLSNYCTPLRVEDRKLFEEGKNLFVSSSISCLIYENRKFNSIERSKSQNFDKQNLNKTEQFHQINLHFGQNFATRPFTK